MVHVRAIEVHKALLISDSCRHPTHTSGKDARLYGVMETAMLDEDMPPHEDIYSDSGPAFVILCINLLMLTCYCCFYYVVTLLHTVRD